MIYLIHGIRAKDKGISSMRGLESRINLRGWKTRLVSYGYVLIPITNKRAVEKTIEAIKQDGEPIILVGYSNGGHTAVQVAELGYNVDRLILISPALHAYHEIPRHVKKIDVFYSDEDMILTLAKWYRWVNRLLPWRWFNRHDWGEAGRIGLQQDDPRITNHDMGSTGHFFYNYDEVMDMIVDIITKENEK